MPIRGRLKSGQAGACPFSARVAAIQMTSCANVARNLAVAGELPLDITVDESANDPATPARIVAVGRRLVDELGAAAVVLGCAGMAAHKKPAAEALRVPPTARAPLGVANSPAIPEPDPSTPAA